MLIRLLTIVNKGGNRYRTERLLKVCLWIYCSVGIEIQMICG